MSKQRLTGFEEYWRRFLLYMDLRGGFRPVNSVGGGPLVYVLCILCVGVCVFRSTAMGSIWFSPRQVCLLPLNGTEIYVTKNALWSRRREEIEGLGTSSLPPRGYLCTFSLVVPLSLCTFLVMYLFSFCVRHTPRPRDLLPKAFFSQDAGGKVGTPAALHPRDALEAGIYYYSIVVFRTIMRTEYLHKHVDFTALGTTLPIVL